MGKSTYDRGLKIRKNVLGDEFVDKAIASADDFNRPIQDLTTEYCRGYVWGRQRLSHKTRSFLNLAILCALNRPHELKTHVRSGRPTVPRARKYARCSCRSRSIAACRPAWTLSATRGKYSPSWTKRNSPGSPIQC